MTFKGLIKMKCCVVCFSGVVTAMLLIFTPNMIHAGISGTIGIIYGIALLMLVSIGLYDRCVNKGCEEPLIGGLPAEE